MNEIRTTILSLFILEHGDRDGYFIHQPLQLTLIRLSLHNSYAAHIVRYHKKICHNDITKNWECKREINQYVLCYNMMQNIIKIIQ
jgi:hypothetical protein